MTQASQQGNIETKVAQSPLPDGLEKDAILDAIVIAVDINYRAY